MLKPFKLTSVILLLGLALSACNLPSAKKEETGTNGASAVLTAAALTVEANLTQAALQNPPTAIPTSTTVVPTATLPALPTSPPPTVATATQDCDKADFVTDVTIPDGTVLSPNEAFTKTWRLRNSGTCSWTPAYAIVFSSGDAMGGPATQAMVGNINPGDTVDISVTLKAPATAGDYKGYWKLRNSAGVLFATIYLDIKVGGGGPFAVTGVTMSVAGSCGNFQITANVTTNGAGTVTYKWKYSDGTIDNTTHPDLVFDAAGTKSVSTSWATNTSGAKWMEIYIDKPNHQQFGRANFSCP